MNIVIPMAGRGSRFAEVGISTPKPLIPVRGRPMYTWAMDSLPLSMARRLIFICLQEHLENLALAEDIQQRYERYEPIIVPLAHVTQGQACTVLEAVPTIDTDEPLLIYNADTYCRNNLEQRLRNESAANGIISVFQAPGDKWSFARIDELGRVLETAEKQRISSWATTGLYYFHRGDHFVKHARAMIDDDQRVGNEFYVAPVYNRLIAAGADVRADFAQEVWVLGTPEDLARFEANYPQERI